jgi:hypothetical protein
MFGSEDTIESMPVFNVKKQTPKEFNDSFKDVLSSLIRKTFDPKDQLLFVTYQPDILTLDPSQVRQDTSQMLARIRYVEVIEQTFKTSNKYNNSGYIDGYHSHLLIREADYNKVKDRFQGLDVVVKVVYDLAGLATRYLSKQAGVCHDRIPPTNHIPMVKLEPMEVKAEKRPIRIILKPITASQSIPVSQRIVKRFIRFNKLFRILRHNDDS